MCFHSKQSKKAQTVEKRFNATIKNIDTFKSSKHYNGFSFPQTPIITNEDPGTVQMVAWGLVPFWANSDWNKSYTLNARIETLHEKKSFKEITNNRCIIIVDGFYEWQHKGKEKIKYEIGFDNELFALAGLYDMNKGNKTYTIITTEAKGIMREIHNSKLRMPVALKSNLQMKHWLNGEEVIPSYDFTTFSDAINQTRLF